MTPNTDGLVRTQVIVGADNCCTNPVFNNSPKVLPELCSKIDDG
jgi:hypothetical protein